MSFIISANIKHLIVLSLNVQFCRKREKVGLRLGFGWQNRRRFVADVDPERSLSASFFGALHSQLVNELQEDPFL